MIRGIIVVLCGIMLVSSLYSIPGNIINDQSTNDHQNIISRGNVNITQSSEGVISDQKFDTSVRIGNTEGIPIESSEIESTSSLPQTDLLLAESLVNMGMTGNIRIGILDNGIETSHSSLEGIEIIQQDFDFGSPGSNSHGTSVASAIAGKMDASKLGLASGATIYSARLGTPAGSPDFVEGDFQAALNWLIANNVSIINISLSGSAIPLNDIIEQATENNILIVGSAGNSGNKIRYTSGISQHPDAFSIGAINSSSYLSSFSGFGYGEYYNDKIDFVQLGENVVTANHLFSNGFKYSFGTSFAAPLFVSGLALLLEYLQTNSIDYSPSAIKALLAKASLTPTIGQGLEMGYGLVNFSRALQLVQTEGLVQLSTLDTKLPYGIAKDHLRGSTDVIPINIYSGTDLDTLSVSIQGNISQIATISQVTYPERSLMISSESGNQLGSYIGNITISNSHYSIIKPVSVTISRDMTSKALLHLGYTSSYFNFINRRDGFNLDEMVGLLWEQGIHVDESFDQFADLDLGLYDLIILPQFLDNLYFNDPYGISRSLDTSDLLLLTNYLEQGGNVYLQTYGDIRQSQYQSVKLNFGASQELIEFLSLLDLDLSQPYYFTNYDDLDNSHDDVNYLGEISTLTNHTNILNHEYVRHYGGYIYPETQNENITIIAAVEGKTGKTLPTIVQRSINKGNLIVSTSDYHFDSCRLSLNRENIASIYTGCKNYATTISEAQMHREFFTSLINYTLDYTSVLDSINIIGDQVLVELDDTYSIQIKSTSGSLIIQRQDNYLDTYLPEGQYELLIFNQTYYERQLFIIDITEPVTKINADLFLYESEDYLPSYVMFEIVDENIGSIDVLVNSSLSISSSHISKFNFSTYDLGLGWFNITITVSDIVGHIVTSVYIIEVITLEEHKSRREQSSPTETESESSNPGTTDNTDNSHTTTKISSHGITPTISDISDTDLFFFTGIIAIFAVFVTRRRIT